jgi:hypothetical protein
MTNSKSERDAELIRRYLGGETVDSLRADFKLTHERIYQILRKAGIPRARRSEGRNQFLGVNLTEPIKDALRAEAERRGLSISALSSDMLRDMLIACGYPLEAEKVAS